MTYITGKTWSCPRYRSLTMEGEICDNAQWGAVRQSIDDGCIVFSTSQIDMAGCETVIEHPTG